VSQSGTGQAGFNGLVNSVDPNGGGNHFESTVQVMVWSAGPDRAVQNTKADQGGNKDNILSWKQ